MTPHSHNNVNEQTRDHVTKQLHDDDIPVVLEDKTPPAKEAPRRGRKPQAAEAESKDYAHRSLYARPETLDLIREIAFKDRTSAQALYREGLLLMLKERGHYQDKTVDDV